MSSDEEEDTETFTLDNGILQDDKPSLFPSLDSAQRSQSSLAPPSLAPPSLAPPALAPPTTGLSSLRATSSSLALPPSTKSIPRRTKVPLEPGHSPLDWAKLKSSGKDLRGGVTSLARVTPTELRRHQTESDAWSAFNGKVYNITPYLNFHPGGKKEMMRSAGRDGTRLFMLTHSWVNFELMLNECMVGIMVSEPRGGDSD